MLSIEELVCLWGNPIINNKSYLEQLSYFTAIGIQLLKQSLKTTDLFEESICAHKKKSNTEK